MAVTDFDTKVAVVVRDDLAVWQKLNVTAFLISGVIAYAGEIAVGEDYLDADGARYLPLLVQPVLIYTAVRAVPTEQLDLVGLALRAAHADADAVLRGLKRHP